MRTFSRLGVTQANFRADGLAGISGLHFHNLCELNADSLARTLEVFEDKFGKFLTDMEWVNFGGGHHITRDDYNTELLCSLIADFSVRHGVQVYLEPGEAIALNTGFLTASVLDIVENGMSIAILDTSAAAHMPDVLEMPYRPEVAGGGKPGEFPFTYRLGGTTCLAGDVIGDYSFPNRWRLALKLHLWTWLIIRWSRTTPSTACGSHQLRSEKKGGRSVLSANSDMKTIGTDSPDLLPGNPR